MRLRISVGCVLWVGLAACGSEQQPTLDPSTPEITAPRTAEPPSFDNPTRPLLMDDRPVVTASTPPPAISGGTLLVSADGMLAVMSDPDRDRVSIVDLQARSLIAHVALEPGDEPGRLVQDAAGRVHVALRRAGMVASIDLAQAALITRTSVCPAPRGLTYDLRSDELLVACASGELARMPVAGGSARTVAQLGTDLRDVVQVGGDKGSILVSRFRSAEVLRLNPETGGFSAVRPPLSRALFGEPSTGALRADTLSPQVAYRLVADHEGSFLLSQIERDGEIDLEQGGSVPMPSEMKKPDVQVTFSPYGGGGNTGGSATQPGFGSCMGVVQPLLTLIRADGSVDQSRRIPGTLIVDAARGPGGSLFAVAQAGQLDVLTAGSNKPLADSVPPSSVLVFSVPFLPQQGVAPEVIPCAQAQGVHRIEGQATAVAFTPDGRVLAQSREPAFLAIISQALGNGTSTSERIDLGGASVADTGHSLFHRNAGTGIACASCHAEGGDDGHTWRFSGMGLRRTQSLHVGLAGSAPFHWAGDERDFRALVEDVMVGRMGGAKQTPERIAALESWLYALPAPPSPRAAADEAAQRGKLLFEGAAECSTCHSGVRLSSNETKDVGKGEPLQVPSLVAIAYRRPLMHDGCAEDLRARFDPACGGGDQHGKTSQLNQAQIDDLIAYLETL
jgi:mono/diheme cytochrome c family protein